MKLRFLVIEMNGKDIKDLDIVGRYRYILDAFTCRDEFKKQNPHGSYMVSIVLTD